MVTQVTHFPGKTEVGMLNFEQSLIPGLPLSLDPPQKRCPFCLSTKPIAEFSCDRSRPDGLARQCRQCAAHWNKERRRENGDLMRVRARRRYSASPDQKRQAAAEYRRSDRGKRLNLAAVRRYRERNAEKYAAHLEVRKAIAAGVLAKPDRCEHAHLGDCGGRLELHHPDYSKPLEVQALCARHHAAQRMKPRTYDDPEPNLFTIQPEPAPMKEDFAEAFRRWPNLRWVAGDGRWACLTTCGDGPTVMLFKSVDGALGARAFLDGRACCDRCTGQHRVVRLMSDVSA